MAKQGSPNQSSYADYLNAKVYGRGPTQPRRFVVAVRSGMWKPSPRRPWRAAGHSGRKARQGHAEVEDGPRTWDDESVPCRL
ncbi:unnamed protein product [Calypogeia fissa]